MIGTEMSRHRFRMHGFVVALVRKANRECFDRSLRSRLHQRHHSRRVNPAGQKGTKRNVGNHLSVNGRLEKTFEFIDRLSRRSGERIFTPMNRRLEN